MTEIIGSLHHFKDIAFLSCYVAQKYIYLLKIAIELLSTPKRSSG